MAALEQLSSRERKLVGGLLLIFGLLLIGLIPIQISSYISSQMQKNEDLRKAILNVQSAQGQLSQQKNEVKTIASRYSQKAPPFSTIINKAATSASIEISNQSDLPAMPRGKMYTERSIQLSVQKTGLKPLAQFIENIENTGYPLAITKLDLNKRGNDFYTVSLTLSAFDRNETTTTATSTTKP